MSTSFEHSQALYDAAEPDWEDDMDDETAQERALAVDLLGDRVSEMARILEECGWHVSGQQLRNSRNLLRDVERRLSNNSDLEG